MTRLRTRTVVAVDDFISKSLRQAIELLDRAAALEKLRDPACDRLCLIEDARGLLLVEPPPTRP